MDPQGYTGLALGISRRAFIKGALYAVAVTGLFAPLGIITVTQAERGPGEKRIISLCPYCLAGCYFEARFKEGLVAAIRTKESHFEGGEPCMLGKNIASMLRNRDLYPLPAGKENGVFDKIWSEAIVLIVKK